MTCQKKRWPAPLELQKQYLYQCPLDQYNGNSSNNIIDNDCSCHRDIGDSLSLRAINQQHLLFIGHSDATNSSSWTSEPTTTTTTTAPLVNDRPINYGHFTTNANIIQYSNNSNKTLPHDCQQAANIVNVMSNCSKNNNNNKQNHQKVASSIITMSKSESTSRSHLSNVASFTLARGPLLMGRQYANEPQQVTRARAARATTATTATTTTTPIVADMPTRHVRRRSFVQVKCNAKKRCSFSPFLLLSSLVPLISIILMLQLHTTTTTHLCWAQLVPKQMRPERASVLLPSDRLLSSVGVLTATAAAAAAGAPTAVAAAAATSMQQQAKQVAENQLNNNNKNVTLVAPVPIPFDASNAMANTLVGNSNNHLMVSAPSLNPQPLIDDELLNEIISPLVLDEAYQTAKEMIVKRRKFETQLIREGFVTDMSKPTAVARHQRVTTTTTRGNELEKAQEVFEEMTRLLARNLTDRIHLGAGQAGLGPEQADLFETADSMQLLSRIDLHAGETRHAVSRCEEDQIIQCDPSFPFRHSDGSCNNLQHPTWGKANTCFARLLPPDYSDGQSAPRISVTGNPLPNPRILSAIVHRDFNYPATYTHFVMQYGQFFAHDIAFTPSSRTKTGQMIQCCPIERDSHPQCFPILVPPDDPFYSKWEENCLNFVRTAVCPRCRLGPREQMNQITSFIDGSQVYGSAANETAALWTKSGPAGRMHVSFDENGRELLPHSADPSNDQCSDVEKRQFCYRAGDRRVNQHPALTSVHVMWLRQHNRIVNGLKMVNAHWNGDRLYQEAKRITTSQMQMVTYNEWLSLIIGQEAMKFLKLNVLAQGYTQYDPSVDPSLLNEFSGAAFRFGHSMINNIFAEILPDGRPSGYRLNEFFFHPFGMKSGQYDMIMRGLISQASQNRDPFVSSDIKNHLYRPRDNPYGLDLPAFNIQRGRDHGIPGYTRLIEFCFDDVVTHWKQLDQYMPVSQRIRFSKLYRSVHDLDLFSAGLAEYPLPGAALGPTFTCIVGIQMFNLKFGDRFWFEHGGQVGSFSPAQLQEIRKTNLARLMCANSDNIDMIQKNVFRGESPSNPSVPCNSLPDLDMKAWFEPPGSRTSFADAIIKMEEDEKSSYNQQQQGNYQKDSHQQQEPVVVQQPLAYGFVEPISERRPTKYIAKRPPPPRPYNMNYNNNNNINKKYLKQKMEPNFRQRYPGPSYPMPPPPRTPALSFNMLYGASTLVGSAIAPKP